MMRMRRTLWQHQRWVPQQVACLESLHILRWPWQRVCVCEQYDDQDEPFDEQERIVAASAIGAETPGAETPSGDHEHHDDEEHVVTTSAMGVTARGMPKKLAYPPIAMATSEPSVALATCVLL